MKIASGLFSWRAILAIGPVLLWPSLASAGDSCSQLSYPQNSQPLIQSDGSQHVTGQHGVDPIQNFTDCEYQGNLGENCDVTMLATGNGTSAMEETGAVDAYGHEVALGYFNSSYNGPSPGTAVAATVGGVRDCTNYSCSDGFNIQVSYPPLTVIFSPPPALWSANLVSNFVCKQETGQACKAQYCGTKYIWSYILCECQYVGGSPIIIDTLNVGFHLSKPVEGTCAPFDLPGDGEKKCWSWPEVGSGNGWLVLPFRTHPHDRDNPALAVTSGKDMFGNFTEQPESKNKNGYDALTQFALVQNGGFVNRDGQPELVLSAKDKVWDDLRIWIPEDYSGVPKFRELHKLSEFGIWSIDLIPAEYTKTDEWGNRFEYGAPLNIPAKDARTWFRKNDSQLKTVIPHELNVQTYDVWLVNSDVH